MARLFAVLAVVAVVAGGVLVARSLAPSAPAAALATASPTSSAGTLVPLAATLTRDRAIEVVRGRGKEIFRVERIAAKLTTIAELGARAGAPWGKPATGTVWAVAVGGDVAPANFDGPGRPYHWAVYSVAADTGQPFVVYVNAGPEPWPPFFDVLADHPIASAGTGTAAPPSLSAIQRVGTPGIGGTYTSEVTRVVLQPVGGRLFAVSGAAANTGRTRRLFASPDGGATWRQVQGVGGGDALDVAVVGENVVVADATRSGLRVSGDGGLTWGAARGRDAAADGALSKPFEEVYAVTRADGRTLALAETRAGPSTILASFDGMTWGVVTTIPALAVFAGRTVPLVSSAKMPGDSLFRVDGDALDALRLVPLSGSPHTSFIAEDPATGDLWAWARAPIAVFVSHDQGKTWTSADRGMADPMVARPFFVRGSVLAFGATSS